ncbi:AI-2E family transporter [Corynebacterium silvaticum]|uniref:AI-2E family transporter n=1 Tax=Corynebacterium silvaticum TaxID=2320431 RepID=A0A7Y4LJN0_9CORY|nr:AI-2E family transporter [Corynebacterium silvaticum]ARU45882.1 AI-2E family transporter [Corynebacterium silvaticum]NON69882.1 AI-2E family transporter [Corynebacterium silvaticum]UWH00996.1 AI-2E family transporter [Corynebacterium silvaticum]UWH03041.1 AI-2E family transporter [Corynebacterium silvaticum]UWH05079.1 AI-2E family transporter [Corynebacterium silvaticum]
MHTVRIRHNVVVTSNTSPHDHSATNPLREELGALFDAEDNRMNQHAAGSASSQPTATPGNTEPVKPRTEPSTRSLPDEEATAIFEELEPSSERAHIDRSEIIADGVKVLAQWCIRILIIAATGFAGWYVIKQFWRGLLPVVLALIVCTVLWGPTAWMRKRGVPSGLAALVSILASFSFFGGLIWAISPDIARQSQTLYFQAFEGIQKVQLWLQGPPFNLDSDELSNRINTAVQWFQRQSGTIAGEIFSGIGIATSALVTIGVVLVLTFFFLKDGEGFLPWLRSIVGKRAGWHLTELLTRSWITLGGFVRAQALVSLVDAIFIGAGLILLGVPMALALAVLTFIAGFIPIIGAFVAGALAVLVALVSLGLTKAIITLLIVLAVQQLEGNVLSPLLQSRAMNLHPVVVLVSVTVGGGLFGIMGAFLAVPAAAMIAVLFRYLQDMTALRAGEKSADEITFVTTAGSITGKFGERRGKELLEKRRREQQDQKTDDPHHVSPEETDTRTGAISPLDKLNDLVHFFDKHK